ncbi:A-kinase anchor protein 14 [Clonorchis sinensis]|uniref:A-kinase anchor protein 14 n=1 Tax=Clonorchis sinensis TaxID=79923 RepID=G7YUF2_CLOSI|nr:A-kinase anchor protein 14 [Clonorchis sinensis]
MIRPFVDSVVDEALKQVSDVDPNRMIIDFNDPILKEDPHYCELKQQGPREDVPEGIRGFVASIIQTALHRVYEYDLSKEPKIEPIRVPENDEFLPKAKQPVEVVETPRHGRLKSSLETDESSVVSCEKSGKHPIVLDNEPNLTPNIKWPTIGEFNPELGLKRIEEYIKGWQVDESWLHCTDILSEEDTPYDVLYRYRVRWSVPTRRAPIPQATASIYFTIKVSKIKPKMQDVDVYYQVETFRTTHKPGATRFCEQWLRDVIDSKLRLLPYITF